MVPKLSVPHLMSELSLYLRYSAVLIHHHFGNDAKHSERYFVKIYWSSSFHGFNLEMHNLVYEYFCFTGISQLI